MIWGRHETGPASEFYSWSAVTAKLWHQGCSFPPWSEFHAMPGKGEETERLEVPLLH